MVGGNTYAQYQSLRYRGYYYDTETRFYYLNSRYYDPKVSRFISADDTEYLGTNGDIEVFRWDENPNYSNGSHYHIYGTGHYYPGEIVPEPYATIYFPVR